MQTLYEHSRRILAVFLIAALLCLAIIGPLPDTQSSATLTCTTTGIAAISVSYTHLTLPTTPYV